MKYAITLLLTFFFLSLQAQPDSDRMRRDIEVAENILASLIQEEYDSEMHPVLLFGSQSQVQGDYLEDFGVLFTIASGLGGLATVGWKSSKGSGKGEDDVTIVVPERRVLRGSTRIVTSSDSTSLTEGFRNLVRTFMADYAYLLRQIPEDEKIMIRYGSSVSPSNSWGTVWVVSGHSGTTVHSAVAAKSDLTAFEKGRIAREELLDRIQFTAERDDEAGEDRDLKLLSSIFSRLYQRDLSGTFFMRGTPTYEKIEGLGAILYLPITSGHLWGGKGYTRFLHVQPKGNYQFVLPDLEEEDPEETGEEAANELENAYPEFLEELKRNIVEYGSIAKDLQTGEALIFRIQLPRCSACERMPEKVAITAPQSVLEAYRSGKMDLDEATDQLKIE